MTKSKFGIFLFGWLEVIIGLATLIGLAEAKIFFNIIKPLPVFLFVSLTASASFILGVGILQFKMWARKFLLFFAGYIVMTKVFISLGIIQLSPPFETLIPSSLKNLISLSYHILIILFFGRETIRHNFK